MTTCGDHEEVKPRTDPHGKPSCCSGDGGGVDRSPSSCSHSKKKSMKCCNGGDNDRGGEEKKVAAVPETTTASSSSQSCCKADGPKEGCCGGGGGGGGNNSPEEGGGRLSSSSSCCAGSKSEQDQAPKNVQPRVMCVAVLKDQGSEVDVYDASGRGVSFTVPAAGDDRDRRTTAVTSTPTSSSSTATAPVSAPPKICFSSHGLSSDADGFMTPCFDSDGLHGEPEEECFCGVDTPHLHAHLHDPERCGGGDQDDEDTDTNTTCDSGGDCGGGDIQKNSSVPKKKKKTFHDITQLAQLTLHPKKVVMELKECCVKNAERVKNKGSPCPTCRANGEEIAPLNATPSLPKVCNSGDFARRLVEKGWERESVTGLHRRRLFKVKHDDHYDYLVHNDKTGNLHLEHPCNSCGDVDYHGKLKLVGRRSWEPQEEDGGGNHRPDDTHDRSHGRRSSRNDSDGRRIHLHFFEAAAAPMDLLDLLSDFFSTETSSRVNVVRNCCSNAAAECGRTAAASAMASSTSSVFPGESAGHGKKTTSSKNETTNIVTSTFVVKGICCCAEVPVLDDMITCLPGVSAISVDVPSKTVTVHHDPNRTSARHIENAVNADGGFEALIQTDGGSVANTAAGTVAIRSMFFVCAGLCCSSEVPLVTEALSPLDGVYNVSVDVPTKIVRVDHDPSTICTDMIRAVLNEDGFNASPVVRNDSDCSAGVMVLSSFVVKDICCSGEVPLLTELLEPLLGVGHVSVDVPAKMVTVVRDGNKITAKQVEAALQDDGWDARLRVDAEEADDAGIIVARPRFLVKGMCCTNEVALVKDVLSAFPGIGHVEVDVPTKTVRVDCVASQISARDIEAMLNAKGLDATALDADDKLGSVKKSVFHVQGICCSSEVPLIEQLLLALSGVDKVSVCVPTKTVSVDHICSMTDAKRIESILNQDGFKATWQRSMDVNTPAETVQSKFIVRAICCSSEVPLVKDLIVSLAGVDNVSVNVPSKIVYVDHDPDKVLPMEIEKILNREGLDASLQSDHSNQHEAVVRSNFDVDGICCSSEVPIVKGAIFLLAGVRTVSVDVATRTVSVDHVPSQTTTSQIETALLKDGFESKLMPKGEDSSSCFLWSKLTVEGICCTAEVPIIEETLCKLPGVKGVLVDVPSKVVSVHHDPSVTSANAMKEALNSTGCFVACLGSNGSETNSTCTMDKTTAVSTTDGISKSQFRVENICCASEIPAIHSILTPLAGVGKISVIPTMRLVYVDHDVSQLTAQSIADALTAEGFPTKIKKDGGIVTAMSASQPVVKKYVESTLVLPNVYDENGASQLENFLRMTFDRTRVQHFDLHVPSKTLRIDHNPKLVSAEAIGEALKSNGMEASVLVDGFVEGRWCMVLAEEEEIEVHMARIQPHIVASGISWVISMFSLIGGKWEYLKYVALLSVAFGLPKIALKSFRTLRRRQIDANCLMFIAALGALALQDFLEAAAVTFLFSISEWLESICTARARNALAAIVKLRPERANLFDADTNRFVVVPAAAVPVGSVVSVRTGDKVPCDGVITEGSSTVDESSLTGESRPVKKIPRDTVSGGTINSGMGLLQVRTTSTVDDSAVARLIKLVEEAQANRSPTEMMVDAFAKRYTPLVVLTALLMCSIPWAFGVEVGKEWTKLGLTLVVVACPCALIISTPVTYVAGLASAAQRGVLVKGGAHLEALGKVSRIALDKTGTLTEGRFALLHLHIVSETRSRKSALETLALVEAHSSHPLGAALVAAAKNEGLCADGREGDVKDHVNLEGEGIYAILDGKAVHVGNERLFKRLGLLTDLPEAAKVDTLAWAETGGTVGFMSIEDEGIVACYSVADAVRSEAADAVSGMKNLGITVTMLTGDNRSAAMCIGKQVGLDEDSVKSQLLPGEKLQLINDMIDEDCNESFSCCDLKDCNRFFCFCSPRTQNRRLVLMCGDGVNDAPALAAADVGVAMGAGAALAMETADVTLLDSDLTKLVKSLRLGRRAIRKIRENVVFSLAVKAVVMGLTFARYTTLWAAIAADVGAMLIVTINGMTLLPTKRSLAKSSSTTKEMGGQIEKMA